MTIPGGGPALLLAAALACGGHAPPPLAPVQVEGASREVRALEGRWEGRFENTVAGRSGTIAFHLDPGSRTGRGSVAFVGTGRAPVSDAELGHPESRAQGAGRTVLPIGRLVVDRGSVAGWLESYRDAERGCVLETRFEGTREADTIRGAFFAHPALGDTIQVGQWWAAKVR